ncbi:SPW repeat protein [Natronosalvus halobius]|uniref:SPW repeat protein n=1 Tax=Natronosalvus halobius TaxID=2953746 RepID=UPI00209FB5B5|nr:SPW repeat protein [Natronosalvus halobius]USZ70229.1 SPW repeat protein [Natronosalvus halobius]
MSDSSHGSTDAGTDDRTTRTATRGNASGQKWLSGLVSLIGIWIAVSPFVYGTAETATWNNVLVGASIFLLAGYNYYRIQTAHPSSTPAMSLVAILGLWVLLSPFVLAYGTDTGGASWSTIVSGALTALLAGYVAYAGGRTPTGAGADAADGAR